MITLSNKFYREHDGSTAKNTKTPITTSLTIDQVLENESEVKLGGKVKTKLHLFRLARLVKQIPTSPPSFTTHSRCAPASASTSNGSSVITSPQPDRVSNADNISSQTNHPPPSSLDDIQIPAVPCAPSTGINIYRSAPSPLPIFRSLKAGRNKEDRPTSSDTKYYQQPNSYPGKFNRQQSDHTVQRSIDSVTCAKTAKHCSTKEELDVLGCSSHNRIGADDCIICTCTLVTSRSCGTTNPDHNVSRLDTQSNIVNNNKNTTFNSNNNSVNRNSDKDKQQNPKTLLEFTERKSADTFPSSHPTLYNFPIKPTVDTSKVHGSPNSSVAVGNPIQTMTSVGKGGFLLSSGPLKRGSRKGSGLGSGSGSTTKTASSTGFQVPTSSSNDVGSIGTGSSGTTLPPSSPPQPSSPNAGSRPESKSLQRSKDTARMAALLMNLRYADETSNISDYGTTLPTDTRVTGSPLTSNGKLMASSLAPSNSHVPKGAPLPLLDTSFGSSHMSHPGSSSPISNANLDSVTGSNHPPSPTVISSTTRARAIRAKARLELQYEMISEYQTGRRRNVMHFPEEPDENKHDVESSDHVKTSENDNNVPSLGDRVKEKYTYNPLQVIRNRVAKKEQGNGYLHYIVNNTAWNFYWHVDVSELVSDYAWRIRYGGNMRDREGKLLYPDRYKPDIRQDQDNDTSGANTSGTGVSDPNNLSTSASKGEELIQRIKSKLSSRPPSGINSNENSDSSWSRSDISDLEDNRANHRRENRQSTSSSRRNSESPTRKVPFESVNNKGRYSTSASQRKLSISNVPLAVDETAADDSLLLEPTKNFAEADQSALTAKRVTPTSVSSTSLPSEQQQDKLAYYANELRYLDMVYELSYLQISRKPYWYVENLNQDTAESMSTEMMALTKQFEGELIPKERQYLANTEQEMRKLQFDLTQDYGSRLDSVLLDSDRILNEVNTSLSLEIRKVGMRLDKLEANAPTLQWMWKLAYMLLEWLLVAFMWLAWGVVVGMRQLRRLVALVYGIVKWLLWCS
ncbi:hypothetical protein AWJ20_2019 [Sugiyamaella lignohabitans]|uniref:Uncharacterized protein n=1 Tax=Sugiyamaella lignohabitans TaxID=796027 RepID=A0A167ETE2_9ASCO|nr:uncharacterized protein AWJ20_2019 [Sugiyamaella lignohabitans]ANB14431.1 hypothetical protein AWJ20_2019 [Sugiyamaella lignohabitans]